MNNSPSKIIWKRYKRNIPAMTGLFIITAFAIAAVFCYFIIPDNSPNSNQMLLPISMQKPGFTVSVLYIKKPDESKSILKTLLWGSPPTEYYIPLQRWHFENDELVYEEFTGDSSANIGQKIKLKSLTADAPINVMQQNVAKNLIRKKSFLLGTDRYGRDMLSRMIVGARVSLSVGLIAVAISLFLGILLGSLAGYFRGATDVIIMWLINVVWSIPTLLLVIAITLALGKGFTQVFIAVGLTMWVEVARIVRGQIFSMRELQFIEAGRALGFRNNRIIQKHLLPNLMGPVIVIAASNFASAILLEAGLSFLGMGAQPPVPSWGMMIKENYRYIVVDASYLAILPGSAIALMVLSFTLVGNGLRDAFDTRLMLTASA
jgi:peptide/nickel transport system permease protein